MKKSRWGGLDTAVNGFLDELDNTLQDEQCALVSYSSDGSGCGYHVHHLGYQLRRWSSTTSQSATTWTRLSSQPVQGNTAISAGIDNGVKVLTSNRVRPFAVRTMVVMTDGLHNTGREPILVGPRSGRRGTSRSTRSRSATTPTSRG